MFPEHATTDSNGKLLKIKDVNKNPLESFDVKVHVNKEAHIIKPKARQGPKLIHGGSGLDINDDPSIIQKQDVGGDEAAVPAQIVETHRRNRSIS